MKTVLAHLPVPNKGRSRAQESVIVKTLHYGNTCILAGIVGGRRDEGNRILEVGDVWLLPRDEGFQFPVRFVRPDRIRTQSSRFPNSISLYFSVIPRVSEHDVTIR